MVDAAFRTAPVPAEPAAFDGATVSLAAPLARWSIRGRDTALIGQQLGMSVPARIGTRSDALTCLGPDEWLCHQPLDTPMPACEGLPMAITDISERGLRLTVEGKKALSVLSSGCPRNLARLPVGEARRTVYEGVEIIVFRESETRFAVEVWRSFASWLWTALTKAAAHA